MRRYFSEQTQSETKKHVSWFEVTYAYHHYLIILITIGMISGIMMMIIVITISFCSRSGHCGEPCGA